MHDRGPTAVALLLVLSVSAATLPAQRSVHLALGGGSAIPVGKTDSSYSAGPMAMLAVIAGPQTSFLGMRLDASYNQLNGRDTGPRPVRNLHLNAVTANLVATLPSGYVKPYAVVGAGWYPVREPVDGKRHNEFGANGGLGLTFPFFGAAGFVEARYHKVAAPAGVRDRRFVPITVGIVF